MKKMTTIPKRQSKKNQTKEREKNFKKGGKN